MLTKNHKISNEIDKIEKNKEKMIQNFPELFSNDELQHKIDNKIKLKQHGGFLLDYIKNQNKEFNGSSDTKKKLQSRLKQLLKNII
jgi:hypothetical protein